MAIFYCVLARVAPSKSLENDLQQLQMSNFFLRPRRAIFFTITYSVIWTQSRAKTTAVYLHQWYRHRVLTVIRYFWPNGALKRLYCIYTNGICVGCLSQTATCAPPRVPPFVSSQYAFHNAVNVYIRLHERLPVQEVIYTPHKARNMAPWTSLSLTIGYMPSKTLMIKDIQAPEGRRKKLGPYEKI